MELIIQIFNMFWITLLPLLELRASIPYGILIANLHWFLVFLVCSIANILIAPLIWLFLKYLIFFFLKLNFIRRLYIKTVIKTQHKVHYHISKYGTIGLAIFIGIPLPGTGVYTAALAAYILGFRFRDFLIASILGVLIAGAIVTIVILSGNTLFTEMFTNTGIFS